MCQSVFGKWQCMLFQSKENPCNLKGKNEKISISVAFCHLSILDLSDKISAEKSNRTKSR